MTAALFVAGNPAPQGSKRHVGNGRMIESSKRLPAWRKAVAHTARAAGMAPIDGPVALALVFVMHRPTSERKTTTRAHTRRPDIDKLTRAVMDGLDGLAYHDDSQVTRLAVDKRTAEPGETPGAHIVVTSAGPDSTPVAAH